jgi:Tfp pilus assembly protein PilF
MNNYAWYCLVKKINLEEALLMIAEAIRLDPNDREKLDTYAAFLFMNGNYIDAEKNQRKAMDLGAGKRAGYNERYGNILFKLGREKEALKYWQRELKFPEHSQLVEEKVAQKRYIE